MYDIIQPMLSGNSSMVDVCPLVECCGRRHAWWGSGSVPSHVILVGALPRDIRCRPTADRAGTAS
jgi:hypothetical protein